MTAEPIASHLDHGDAFKDGTRVLMLKSRHKDGYQGKERAIIRQSNSMESFNEHMSELRLLLRASERIYSSASKRDLMKAGRIFGERFITSTYDPPDVREKFHRRMVFNWYSCLMQPKAAKRNEKWWMFDCDDVSAYDLVRKFTSEMSTYSYESKSGHHVLVRPYDRTTTPEPIARMLDVNPLMLWSFT